MSLSTRIRSFEKHAPLAVFGAGVVMAVILGAAIILMPPKYTVVALLACMLGAIMVFEPFVGLLALLAYYFLQPGTVLPALNTFHGFRYLILLLLAAWLLRQMYGTGKPLVRHRLNLAMVLFLGSMVLSIPLAAWPGRAFTATLDFAKMAVLYLLVANLMDTRPRLKIALGVIAVAIGFVAMLQMLGHFGLYSGSYVRASTINDLYLGATYTRTGGAGQGFLGHPDDFAVALLFVIPLSYAALMSAPRASGRILFAVLTGIFAYSLALTGSRGGAVGFLCLLLFGWLLSRQKFRLAIVGLCGLTLLWFAAPQSFRQRISTLSTGIYRADPGVQARYDAWGVATQMFLDNPLTGVGAGNFDNARWSGYRLSGERTVLTAHSIYFLLIAELGVIGLAAFCFLVVSAFVANHRARARLRGSSDGSSLWLIRISHGLDASLAGYLVSGAFITVLTYPYPYLIAGSVVALSRLASAGPDPVLGGEAYRQ